MDLEHCQHMTGQMLNQQQRSKKGLPWWAWLLIVGTLGVGVVATAMVSIWWFTSMPSGRYCEENNGKNCWEMDFDHNEASALGVDGQRRVLTVRLRTGRGSADWETDNDPSFRVEFKRLDRNTIGVRHFDQKDSTEWKRFRNAD